MSPARRGLLAGALSRHEVAGGSPVDWGRVFGRRAPLVVEVGSGSGEHLVECALSSPGRDHVALEFYLPGICNMLKVLDREGIRNVRVVRTPAREALGTMFADGAVDTVHVLFPDPWPKRRHRKRRLVDREFMGLLARKIAPGGILHVATDWPDYARDIRRAAEGSGLFEDAGAVPARQAPTRFEARAAREGRAVEEFLWRRARGDARPTGAS